jgi:hypothetical protein
MTQLAGRDKAHRMGRDSMNNGLLVMRASGKGFWLWFSISCAAALVGFVFGLVGLGGYGVKYARELHIPYVALLPAGGGTRGNVLAGSVRSFCLCNCVMRSAPSGK